MKLSGHNLTFDPKSFDDADALDADDSEADPDELDEEEPDEDPEELDDADDDDEPEEDEPEELLDEELDALDTDPVSLISSSSLVLLEALEEELDTSTEDAVAVDSEELDDSESDALVSSSELFPASLAAILATLPSSSPVVAVTGMIVVFFYFDVLLLSFNSLVPCLFAF